MTDRERVRNRAFAVSAAAWSVLMLQPGGIVHCAVTGAAATSWRASVQMLLAMNSIASVAVGWIVMLVAMMSPVLIQPILHVVQQTFRDRRARSVLLFVAGYAAVWLVAGALMLAIELAAAVFDRQLTVAVIAGAAAAMWQFSPAKQYCLNRGHTHVALAAFGFAADRDALRFGVTHATWCVGSCWALMLWPMLLPSGQGAAMAAMTFLIFSERLEHPVVPRWSWRLSSKLIRIIRAQLRIRAAVLAASN